VFGAEDVASAGSSSRLAVSFYLRPRDTVSAFEERELQPLTHYRMEPKSLGRDLGKAHGTLLPVQKLR
jgi:hypothetical protein